MSDITIVTASWNRLPLLKRLYASLLDQESMEFSWTVVDDGSTDATAEWLAAVAKKAPFPIRLISHEQNQGKCASLNSVFRQIQATFYLVVDSDDLLHPSAVTAVLAKVATYASRRDIGAILFSYEFSDGTNTVDPQSDDIVLTRAEHDARHEKRDGSIGYFSRVVTEYRYPEYVGENYVGPTVLQLLMAPRYRVAFVPDVIGMAEYQSDGITRQGRQLRVKNPCGMMDYAGLIRTQSPSRSIRLKYSVMYVAYQTLARCRADRHPDLGGKVRNPIVRGLGYVLAHYWKARYLKSG